MLLPSTLAGMSPIGPAILHPIVGIRPPYPLQREDGDVCLFPVADPQPHRPVDSSSKPEQAARADIDALLSAAGWVVQDYQASRLGDAGGIVLCAVPPKSGRRWPQ